MLNPLFFFLSGSLFIGRGRNFDRRRESPMYIFNEAYWPLLLPLPNKSRLASTGIYFDFRRAPGIWRALPERAQMRLGLIWGISELYRLKSLFRPRTKCDVSLLSTCYSAAEQDYPRVLYTYRFLITFSFACEISGVRTRRGFIKISPV